MGRELEDGGNDIAISGMVPPDMDVPDVVRVVGRSRRRENADLNGEYRICGTCQGKPAYRKPGTTVVIRYWPPQDRWLIDREGLRESDICNAFAEQRGAPHPATEELIWHVWETSRKRHVADPGLLVTTAPETVQCEGRLIGKENDALCGEYTLVGLHQGKVAYQKLGTQHAIRYWPPGDRWLVDFEGLRDADLCNGYCDARGTSHPGQVSMVWHVWETTRGRHIVDEGVRTFVAPRSIEMLGRDTCLENHAVNGTYHLLGLHEGKPAYKQGSTGHTIRYWPAEDRWLVDAEGLRDSDICNVFADACGTDHPGYSHLVWHIWDSGRRRHMPDATMRATVAPRVLEVAGRDAAKENHAINGVYHLAAIHAGKPAYKKVGGSPGNHVIRYWPSEDRWLIDAEGLRELDVANAYANAHGADHPGVPALIWHVWETSRGRHLVDEDVVAAEAPPTPLVRGGPADPAASYKGKENQLSPWPAQAASNCR